MTLELGADLYEACQQISPRHEDYAIQPIEDSFDWTYLSYALERYLLKKEQGRLVFERI